MPETRPLRPSELVGAPRATCGAAMVGGPAYVEVRYVDGEEQLVPGVGYCSNDCAAAEMARDNDADGGEP